MRSTGYYIPVNTGDEPFQAFVPHPLPPDPPLKLSAGDMVLLSQADRAVGRLDALRVEFADPALPLYYLVRKEAVL